MASFALPAAEGASLLCFPEGFLQRYLTDETPARQNALDLTSPAFGAVLNRLPKTGPMIVMGLIEVQDGRLFNTAIVVERGAVSVAISNLNSGLTTFLMWPPSNSNSASPTKRGTEGQRLRPSARQKPSR